MSLSTNQLSSSGVMVGERMTKCDQGDAGEVDALDDRLLHVGGRSARMPVMALRTSLVARSRFTPNWNSIEVVEDTSR